MTTGGDHHQFQMEFKGDWTDVVDGDGCPLVPPLVKQTTKEACPFYALKLVLEIRHRIAWISLNQYTDERRKLRVDLSYIMSTIDSNRTELPLVIHSLFRGIKAESGLLPWPYRICICKVNSWGWQERKDEKLVNDLLSELEKGPIIGQLKVDDSYSTCPAGVVWEPSKGSKTKYEHTVAIVALSDVENENCRGLSKGERLIFKAIEVYYDAASDGTKLKLIHSKSIHTFIVPLVHGGEIPPMKFKAAIEQVVETAFEAKTLISGCDACAEYLEDQIAHRSRKTKHDCESPITEGAVAYVCVLAEGFDHSSFAASVKKYCAELNVNILDDVCSPKTLGRWVKASGDCYCVIIKDWGKETEGCNVILDYYKSGRLF